MKEGKPALVFTLPSPKSEMSLKNLKDKTVILYFYSKDNTPGCTAEALDFTRLEKKFAKEDAVILGVSKDSVQSHGKFCREKSLTVTLLSDPSAVVQKQFGVWRPKKFMGREFLGTVRSTFLIDKSGVIRKIWDPVKVKGHAEAVLLAVKELSA